MSVCLHCLSLRIFECYILNVAFFLTMYLINFSWLTIICQQITKYDHAIYNCDISWWCKAQWAMLALYVFEFIIAAYLLGYGKFFKCRQCCETSIRCTREIHYCRTHPSMKYKYGERHLDLWSQSFIRLSEFVVHNKYKFRKERHNWKMTELQFHLSWMW